MRSAALQVVITIVIMIGNLIFNAIVKPPGIVATVTVLLSFTVGILIWMHTEKKFKEGKR